MGAADTVPGISGGTIAFIMGIYEKLLQSIQVVDKEFFQLLRKRAWKALFHKIPWGFLVPLLIGLITAIFTLASIVVQIMQTHTHFIWAFFFGLILSSLYFMTKNLLGTQGHVLMSAILFILGAILSIWIMFFDPISLPHSYPMTFFAGFIAICAMILPGISGAFILVLLGQYQYIIQAVAELHVSVLITFLLGAIGGLLSFSHLINMCLQKYHRPTIAALSGILAGSLVSLFPFKTIPTAFTVEQALLCLCIVVGFVIPCILHIINKKMLKKV